MNGHIELETYRVTIEYEANVPIDRKIMRRALSNAAHDALVSWRLGHDAGPFEATVTITLDPDPNLARAEGNVGAWSETRRAGCSWWGRGWQQAKAYASALMHLQVGRDGQSSPDRNALDGR